MATLKIDHKVKCQRWQRRHPGRGLQCFTHPVRLGCIGTESQAAPWRLSRELRSSVPVYWMPTGKN